MERGPGGPPRSVAPRGSGGGAVEEHKRGAAPRVPAHALALATTAGWFLALLALLRWWEHTLSFPGLLLWTCVFIACFVAAAFLRFGRHVPHERRRVWTPLYVWTGAVVATYILYLVFPTFRLQGMSVSSAAIVGVIDVVVPVWILTHGVGLAWDPPVRYVVLAVMVPAVLLLAYGYMIPMPGEPFSGDPPPLTPEERVLRDGLERHVVTLATEIGERNDTRKAALDRAAAYVHRSFTDAGYTVRLQEYTIADQRFEILEVVIDGEERPDEIVVVGGHYDSVEGAPGANDNASGVAAVLELSRLLRDDRPARSIRFVAFPNEEPPFFNTDLMGSRVYAARAARAGDRIVAMLSLETIGYYVDEPGSQRYPFPFSLFYPDRGNFIGFVANLGSRSLVRRSIATFRETATIPAHGVASPAWIPGVNWSDHASFWLHGYRAIMISDTAPFRYPYYHTAFDTPDRLDYERMARVVRALEAVVRELAGVSGPSAYR